MTDTVVRRTWFASVLRSAGAVESTAEVRSRRLVFWLLVLGWVLSVAWRVWLSRNTAMPIAHTDEDSYLNEAQAIAGGPGGFSSETTLMRRIGYPLLISPAFLLHQNFFTTYSVVLVINAMLNATILPLAYVLGRRMLNLSRVTAYAAAFAMATLPATVFYSGVAMIDSVMAPLCIGWLLLVYLWLRDPQRVGLALGSGAFAGLFYLMHTRGLVIVGIHLALAVLLVFRRSIAWRQVAVTAAPVLAAAVLNQLVIMIISNKVHVLGASPGGQTISAVSSGGGLLRVAAATGTQLWYVVVITFGLAGLGWAFAGRQILRREGEAALRWTMGVALVTTLGVAVGSSVILAGVAGKPLDAIYGRYIQMLAPFWLLIGMGAVITATRRLALKQAAVAIGLLVIGGAGVALRLWYVARQGHSLRYGPFGAPDLWVLTAARTEMKPLTATAIAAGGCVLLVLMSRARRLWIPMAALVVLANIITMNGIVDRVVEPALARSMPTPRLVEDLGVRPGEKVAASYGVNYAFRFNLGHEVTWSQMAWFRDVAPADADVVIASWDPARTGDWDESQAGFVRLGGNEAQDWSVWRRK